MTTTNASHTSKDVEARSFLRVAVASEDGRYVQQHFGRARQFLICDIEGENATVVDVRSNAPACGSDRQDGDVGHSDEQMDRSIALVADCDAVVVARIGASAMERLAAKGVRAFIYPDTIERALSYVVDSGLLVPHPLPAAEVTP